MKITIISGGSGNNALYKGIKAFYPQCDIQVLINAYDAGKSTGICRKITNTLGVSDIRKNHSRLYSISETFDRNYYDFLEGRYDLPAGKELETVISYLEQWDLATDIFIQAAKDFFNIPESQYYDYKSFNIANIIYSSLFNSHGYEWTMEYITNLLDISQNVILNSYDNTYIGADTESGIFIDDEGEIVDWCCKEDKIKNMVYFGSQGERILSPNLNQKAIDRLKESDLIIISAGTFWSSIFPTFEYGNLYKAFNESNAKKIWVMNNEQDKDSWGVTSSDFVQIMKKLGVATSNIDLILNNDACQELQKTNGIDCKIHAYSMGNTDGKHDPDKVCKAILQTYLDAKETLIFDFDDTLWSRNSEKSSYYKASVENIKMLNEISKKREVYIISGNSFHSIKKKLSKIYGTNISEFNPYIVADANAVVYKNGQKQNTLSNLVIDNSESATFEEFIKDLVEIEKTPTYLKIKPVTDKRDLLTKFINNYFANNKMNMKATATGYTTIDITTKNNSKEVALADLRITSEITYIGDEIDNGNDSEIAKAATNFVKVDDVFETNSFLKLIE